MASKALSDLRAQAGLDLEATKATARETVAKLEDWTARQRSRLADMVRRKQESQAPRRASQANLKAVKP